MCDEPGCFSSRERAAEKAEARAKDEARLADGSITRAALSRENNMLLRGKVTYKGPSHRIQRLAKELDDE
jgi:hypothetical protein